MAEGEITTFTALTEKFNLPPGNYKKPKLLYCSNGGHFLRILPDGTVDGTRDRSDQHRYAPKVAGTKHKRPPQWRSLSILRCTGGGDRSQR
ncbi:fibroblast growth factor 1 isoform X3 [Eubalaena glacialis]|uniref:fibroblast growth factor 1 isoform X3 n=1 Tax=Eubalaena glacialis TaxID=27606 RepID=UPI002A5AC268|nr:fibroblast growth factor 1 isoform X3 [Eubalaena glacialis]